MNKEKDTDHKELSAALRKSAEKATSLNRVLGFNYIIVRRNQLIEVAPDGSEKKLRKANFGLVNISKTRFKLKNE